MDINLTLLGQAISFILFVWFCVRFVWPPLLSAIEERQKEISDGLERSERSKEILQEAEVQATSIISQAKEEAKEIRSNAQRQSNELLKQAEEKATQVKDDIISKGYIQLENDKKAALRDLSNDYSDAVVLAVRKILSSQEFSLSEKELSECREVFSDVTRS